MTSRFRGQTKTGEIVYGYYTVHNNVHYINKQPVLPDTVGQSTGLFDDNKVEIFTGDVVVTRNYDLVSYDFDDYFEMDADHIGTRRVLTKQRLGRVKYLPDYAGFYVTPLDEQAPARLRSSLTGHGSFDFEIFVIGGCKFEEI